MPLQEQLHELFLVNRQVRGLESRLEGHIRRVRAQQTKLDRLDQQQAELVDQLKHVKVKLADSENQTQGFQNKIKKYRGQMSEVKSNKEYSALLIEVNTLKVENEKIEEQSLGHMAEVDRLEEELKGIETSLVEQQKLVDLAQSKVDESLADIGQELEGLKAKRDGSAAQVPNKLRAHFMRLSEAYEGEALAGVVEANRKALEYSCGGCYMSIPVEHVNAIMMRPEDIVECPNCGRILYLDQELKATFTTKSAS